MSANSLLSVIVVDVLTQRRADAGLGQRVPCDPELASAHGCVLLQGLLPGQVGACDRPDGAIQPRGVAGAAPSNLPALVRRLGVAEVARSGGTDRGWFEECLTCRGVLEDRAPAPDRPLHRQRRDTLRLQHLEGAPLTQERPTRRTRRSLARTSPGITSATATRPLRVSSAPTSPTPRATRGRLSGPARRRHHLGGPPGQQPGRSSLTSPQPP